MRSFGLLAAVMIAAMSVGESRASQPSMTDQILADSGPFAAQIEAKVRDEDPEKSAVLKTIESDLVESAQWRFHPRYRGLLIAIPTRRNLLATDKYAGEAAVVDVVERLIRQRGLSGRVEVVFIEPAATPASPSRPLVCECCPALMPMRVDCGCR